MHEGPKDSVKSHHAELSERQLTIDTWADILRKTSIVVVVATTVWAACALLRHFVAVGSEWLFHSADSFGTTHVILSGIALLVIMTLAGTARGLLLLIPGWKDAGGDGVEKAIVSYHETYDGDGSDPTLRYAKPTFLRAAQNMVLTTLTIGAGGSGGLEAPGVFLGETLAAGWSKIFKRPSADELRLYQLAGIAAAIGTLLEAPFTAALFAAELVYAGRIVYRKLAYCLIAGVLGYTFNNHLLGLGGLFHAPEHARTFVWQECLLVFLVAVGFSAPAAIALGPTFRAADWFFAKIPAVLRGAAGALATWAIAAFMWWLFDLHPHHILGIGEETINDVVAGTGDLVLRSWWVLLLAVVAKMFATAATLRSGGTAGMLIPSMYMGGLVGAAAYHFLNEAGFYAGTSHTVYIATGMAAALTIMAGVPLASIAFVIEVFGSEYGPAAAIACAVCFTASRRFSLYGQTKTCYDDEPK